MSYPTKSVYNPPQTVELIESWLADGERWGRSRATLKLYRWHVLRFYRWFQRDEIPKRADVADFLNSLDCGDQTKASYRASLRAFFNWLDENVEGIDIESNPASKLKMKFAPPRPKDIPSRADILARISSIPQNRFHHVRNRVLILVIYALGTRPSEAANLKASDIDWNTATATIYANKTKSYRTVPIPEPIMAVLEWYREFCGDVLFPNHSTRRDEPIEIRYVGKCWRDYQRAMGIPENERINLYDLRHAFARHSTELDGVPAFTLQQLMGHSSITTTQNYCKPNTESARHKVNAGWFAATGTGPKPEAATSAKIIEATQEAAL